MILRRLYLYLVSAAAVTLLAAGLALLGGTILLFVFNDPSAQYSRGQLAIYTAMAVVALPVWGVHLWFAQRFANRDPFERASALRRLYLYYTCLVMALAATAALANGLPQVLQPVLDNSNNLNGLQASQLGWATVVFVAIFALHFWIATRDRAAVGEEGTSATLRRWYMYIALLVGLLGLLSGGATLLQLAWTKLVVGEIAKYQLLSYPAGSALAGAVLWGFHGRVISLGYIKDDRHSTLRAVEGFIAVAICIATALVGASQILYYLLARSLGVVSPSGANPDVLAAVAVPGSMLLVYGVAWFLLQRRLTRDAGTQEADRQAGVRRLYTNLAALVSLATLAVGAGGLLWTLAEQIEAPIIGVSAHDWRDPASLWVTLFVVGAAVWVTYWRQSPWAADRQALSRKLYVWAALLGSILAILGGGVGMINAVLQQAFSAQPKLNDASNLDVGHYLGVILVAVGVGIYHWRVLRADAAARPARAAPVPPIAKAPAAAAAKPEPVAAAVGQEADRHARRYTLVVSDATDDDVHQALSALPPQASYKLTPSEPGVDGR